MLIFYIYYNAYNVQLFHLFTNKSFKRNQNLTGFQWILMVTSNTHSLFSVNSSVTNPSHNCRMKPAFPDVLT